MSADKISCELLELRRACSEQQNIPEMHLLHVFTVCRNDGFYWKRWHRFLISDPIYMHYIKKTCAKNGIACTQYSQATQIMMKQDQSNLTASLTQP